MWWVFIAVWAFLLCSIRVYSSCGAGFSLWCFPYRARALRCVVFGCWSKWLSNCSSWAPKWSEVAQSCPTLCNPVDCSLPGSSVHGILQTRILERVAISFSRGSSQPRDWTWVSALQADALTSEPPGKPKAQA